MIDQADALRRLVMNGPTTAKQRKAKIITVTSGKGGVGKSNFIVNLAISLKKQGKNEGAYIRVGATNRKASYDNILELERQRMNISYDQEVNREFKLEALDISSIVERFAKFNKSFDETVMKNFKLVHDENGELYPTNGLLIMLGKFEHVRIKCSRFKGNTMDVFLDRKEYEGNLFTQLEDAENFIKNHISLSS